MTSPIDAWNSHYALERARLPDSFDDLEIICCMSEMRVISHVGIELLNCKFNNPALQQIRRRMPVDSDGRVKVRFNTASMRRIWVSDPMTGEYLEVLNQDPDTLDLTAEQVTALERIRRQAQSEGVILNRAQARRRMAEQYGSITSVKTQAARRRTLKLLGLLEASSSSPDKPSKKKARASNVHALPSAPSDSALCSPSTSFQLESLPAGRDSSSDLSFDVPNFKTFAFGSDVGNVTASQEVNDATSS